jgi:hypothetical protein
VSGVLLKRASASRSSGEWNDDDFDVVANGAVVGRIFKAQRSAGRKPVGHSPTHGYSFRPLARLLKMKNADAPAVKREAEEDWGNGGWR